MEIPPAPCGLPQDEAIFDINASGVVFREVLDGAINDLKSILKGASVPVANDGSMFYEFVKGMHDAYKRSSSHVSIVPQYAVRQRQLKTVLAGRCSNGDSWFQFEAGEWCPEENLCGSILHGGTTLNTSAQNFWWNLWVPRSQTTTRWLCSLLERYTSELLEPLRYLRHFQSRRCDPHARYFDLAVLNCVR